MCSLTFENSVLISGLDGVISIKLNIYWTNVSFGLMSIKTNVQNDNIPKICFFFYNFISTWLNLYLFKFSKSRLTCEQLTLIQSDISPIDSIVSVIVIKRNFYTVEIQGVPKNMGIQWRIGYRLCYELALYYLISKAIIVSCLLEFILWKG